MYVCMYVYVCIRMDPVSSDTACQYCDGKAAHVEGINVLRYLCVYVCVYACMYDVCVHMMCMYVCMYVCMHRIAQIEFCV